MQNLYFILLSCLLLLSCKKEYNLDVYKDNVKPAIEMKSHIKTMNIVDFLQKGIHDEFLSSDIINIINKDEELKRKLYGFTSNKIDTIYSYDELPISKEIKSEIRIFDDGTYESTTEFLTSSLDNSLSYYNKHINSEESKIAKIICKNGRICAYNSSGTQLINEIYPEINMKKHIDTMRIVLEKHITAKDSICNKSVDDSKCEIITRITSVEKINQTTYSDNADYERLKSIGVKGVLKQRAEFNQEMDKVLKYETFIGKSLIQKRLYNYTENKLMFNLYNDSFLSENPESIDTYTLIIDRKNKLRIHYSKEIFFQNQILYFSKVE